MGAAGINVKLHSMGVPYGQSYNGDSSNQTNNNASQTDTQSDDRGNPHYPPDPNYRQFDDYNDTRKWMMNPENTSSSTWESELSYDELSAVRSYTGSSYTSMNTALYTKEWDEIPQSMREKIANAHEALNKYEVKKGIEITRQCDFRILGFDQGYKPTIKQLKQLFKDSGTYFQNDGFLSFAVNKRGVAIGGGSGLVLHLRVPPSKGAGAYVNPISMHSGQTENEFLVNTNAVLRFDPDSAFVDSSGRVHLTAYHEGRARMQAIDSKNTSAFAKPKKKKST